MLEVKQNLVSSSKYSLKCPHEMNPKFIIVHNTDNDASANSEISYMIRNGSNTSFHFAVDDKEVVQGIPTNRNTWNAGDGGNGNGNRNGISIEICYSKSGGDRFEKAEDNACKFITSLLKEKGWGIDKVKKHQDFNRKYCPRMTLNLGWERFLNKVEYYLENVDNNSTAENVINNSENSVKNVMKDGEFEVKVWKNGTTNEDVFQDLNMTNKIGTIYPHEYADCLGILNGKYIVNYYVTDKNGNTINRKVGFVRYSGGVK